jgi:hypothetical protein
MKENEMKKYSGFPVSQIVPHNLFNAEISKMLEKVFSIPTLLYGNELEEVKFYEEGQRIVFDGLPIKKEAEVMKFSVRSQSIELNRADEIFVINNYVDLMKMTLNRQISALVDRLIVEFGEPCKSLFYSLPIKSEHGRLYKGNDIYFNSYAERLRWDLSFRVDLFLTPVIYPRDWGMKEDEG